MFLLNSIRVRIYGANQIFLPCTNLSEKENIQAPFRPQWVNDHYGVYTVLLSHIWSSAEHKRPLHIVIAQRATTSYFSLWQTVKTRAGSVSKITHSRTGYPIVDRPGWKSNQLIRHWQERRQYAGVRESYERITQFNNSAATLFILVKGGGGLQNLFEKEIWRWKVIK